jgi:hypothetical protein
MNPFTSLPKFDHLSTCHPSPLLALGVRDRSGSPTRVFTFQIVHWIAFLPSSPWMEKPEKRIIIILGFWPNFGQTWKVSITHPKTFDFGLLPYKSSSPWTLCPLCQLTHPCPDIQIVSWFSFSKSLAFSPHFKTPLPQRKQTNQLLCFRLLFLTSTIHQQSPRTYMPVLIYLQCYIWTKSLMTALFWPTPI